MPWPSLPWLYAAAKWKSLWAVTATRSRGCRVEVCFHFSSERIFMVGPAMFQSSCSVDCVTPSVISGCVINGDVLPACRSADVVDSKVASMYFMIDGA